MKPAGVPSSGRLDNLAGENCGIVTLKVGQDNVHEGVTRVGESSHPIDVYFLNQFVECPQETNLSALANAQLTLLYLLSVCLQILQRLIFEDNFLFFQYLEDKLENLLCEAVTAFQSVQNINTDFRYELVLRLFRDR